MDAALGIAIVSLIVSGWAAWKAGLLQRHDLLLSRRLELHSLLQEADRVLLDHPRLLRAFKTSESYVPVEQWTPEERDHLSQFVVVYLNVFEAAYSVFSQTSRLDNAERAISRTWGAVARSFFEDCPAAASSWSQFRETYYEEFREYVDGMVRGAPTEAPTMGLAVERSLPAAPKAPIG